MRVHAIEWHLVTIFNTYKYEERSLCSLESARLLHDTVDGRNPANHLGCIKPFANHGRWTTNLHQLVRNRRICKEPSTSTFMASQPTPPDIPPPRNEASLVSLKKGRRINPQPTGGGLPVDWPCWCHQPFQTSGEGEGVFTLVEECVSQVCSCHGLFRPVGDLTATQWWV